jgi:glycine cleavage system aminomethyltransferase T
MDIDLKTLKMTDQEKHQLAWCYAYLEDSEAKEIEKEALDFAMAQINGPEAAEQLLELLVDVLIRNAEEQRREKAQ